MSHSINPAQYHKRYHPPVPRKEHIESAQMAHQDNLAKSIPEPDNEDDEA